jgi:Sulfotransferase family
MLNTLLPLDAAKLCKDAQRRTGLRDFGRPRLEPALSTLVQSLNCEADLHPLGRMLMRIHLRGLLETRLRLVEAWKKPDPPRNAFRVGANDTTNPITRPIFIVGVPRSGSTYLHELLAQNPGFRAPRVWEVMFPVRSRDNDANDAQRRVRKTAFCLWCFRILAPQADAVYPMRATTPHECVAIHSYTFLSQEFVSTCRIPSYERFLRLTELTPAYEWEKSFLQYLQSERCATRWVLKSPDHVFGLEQLLKVFPDATIIQTHRNPLEVLRSSTALTRVLRGLYGRPGDLAEVHSHEGSILADGAERFMQFRDEHPELSGRIIDVRYPELIADPVGTVRFILERLRTPVTPQIIQRVHGMASGRARYRGVPLADQPREPALDRRLGLRFKEYCARFGLSFNEPILNRKAPVS